MDLRKLKDKATEAFTKGKFAKAAEIYDEYCAKDPKDLQARLRMGDAFAKSGNKPKAILAYTSAAEGYAREGFLPRAIAASKLILELDPAHKGVQQMLADLYARKTGKPAADTSRPSAGASAVATAPQTPAAPKSKHAPIELPPDEPAAAAPPAAPVAPPPPAAKSKHAPIELPPEPAEARPATPPAPPPPAPAAQPEEISIEMDSAPAAGSKVFDLSLEASGAEIELEPTGSAAPAHAIEIETEPTGSAAPAHAIEIETEPAGSAAPAHAIEIETEPAGSAAPAHAIEIETEPAGSTGNGKAIDLDVGGADIDLEAAAAEATRALEPEAKPAPPSKVEALEDEPLGNAPERPTAAAPAAAAAPPALNALDLAASGNIELDLDMAGAELPPREPPRAPPGLQPAAPPNLVPRAAAPPQPRVSAPPAPPPSSRIWLPGAAEAPAAAAEAAPATPVGYSAAPVGRKARTDLESSFEAFNRFSELEAEPPRPPPPPPPPPRAPAAEAAAPPAAKAKRLSFTELELEGDSLLHAVETAAQVGQSERGEGAQKEDEDIVYTIEETPADASLSAGELPKIPLFSDLEPDAFMELFERCPLRRLGAGERIIEQGSIGDSFFVICGGAVTVFRADAGLRRNLATLKEGAFFGEMALLSGSPRTASVEAAEDETQLLEISASILTELSHRYPQVAQALKKFMRQRLLSNVMSSSALFAPFNKSDRRALVEQFRARDVQKGDVLIREGERTDGLYIVLSGEVEVRKGSKLLARLKEGEIFGEMSLLQKTPATATVQASKRTSLLRLPREQFDSLILSHPQILMLVSDLTDARRRETEALISGNAAMGEEGLMLV